MTTTEEKTCGGCRFWELLGGEVGECHRRAPVPNFERIDPDDETLVVMWPSTYFAQWCGEWERRRGDV